MNAAAPPSPYARLGGEPVVMAIVNRFYDLVEQDEAYAPLRAIHAVDLAPVRHALGLFMTGWLGGPRDWFDRGQCIMAIHRAFPVTRDLADQWAGAMTRAIAGQPDVDPVIAARMVEAMTHMTRGMVNIGLD